MKERRALESVTPPTPSRPETPRRGAKDWNEWGGLASGAGNNYREKEKNESVYPGPPCRGGQ